MKRLIVVCFLLTLLSISGYAQSYIFRVMAQKGQNMYGNGDQWQMLKTGTRLNSGDKIKVGSNGYIGLLHASGSTSELKKEGEYKIEDLSAKISNANQSLIGKYANFVMDKASGREKSDYERLKATGAVKRGAGDGQPIHVFLPNSSELYASKAMLDWEDQHTSDGYKIVFKNRFDEVVLTRETSKSRCMVDFDVPELKELTLLVVSIRPNRDEGAKPLEYGIKRLSSSERSGITGEVSELKALLIEENALNDIILASFFEEKDLIIDALNSYQLAMERYPEIDDFKLYYRDFLVRNGLN